MHEPTLSIRCYIIHHLPLTANTRFQDNPSPVDRVRHARGSLFCFSVKLLKWSSQQQLDTRTFPLTPAVTSTVASFVCYILHEMLHFTPTRDVSVTYETGCSRPPFSVWWRRRREIPKWKQQKAQAARPRGHSRVYCVRAGVSTSECERLHGTFVNISFFLQK